MPDERDERRPEGRGEDRPRREDRLRRDDAPAEEEPKKGKKRGLFGKKKPKKVKKIKKEKKPKKVKVKKEKEVKANKGKKGDKGEKKEGEGGKKKGKKLPVMIALGVVLLGGGFFGLKMANGGGDEGPPPVMLGDSTHVINLGEFLVNTSDGKSFLKANVLLHLADGTHLFDAEGHGSGPGLELTAPYIDVVRSMLSKQSLESLASEEGEWLVKVAIAEAVNKLYHERHEEEGEEGHGKDEPEKEPKDGEEEVEHPSWHSQEGPVLIVYLTDYAWT